MSSIDVSKGIHSANKIGEVDSIASYMVTRVCIGELG